MAFNLKRPAPSWPWLLALFTAASLIEGVSLSHVSAFMPLHLPTLGVLESDVPRVIGRVVAISSAIGMPFMPLWGALADRYARQPVIVRSFIFYLLSIIIMMLAGDLWIFIVGRALMSFTMGNTGLMLTTLTEKSPPHRISLIFSIVEGAIPVGILLGPVIGGPIVDAWGFKTLLLFDAVVMAGMVAGMAFGYRDSFRGTPGRHILLMAADSIRIIFGSRILVAIFAAMLMLFMGLNLVTIYTPIAITQLYSGDDPATAIGVVLSLAGVAALIMAPSSAMLADRYGRWRVLIISTAIMTVTAALPTLASELRLFTLLLALFNGMAVGTVSIAFSVLAQSAETQVRGRVMSLATMPIIIGFMIGPAIGSEVTQSSVFRVYPLAAVFTLLALIAIIFAAKIAKPSPELTQHAEYK